MSSTRRRGQSPSIKVEELIRLGTLLSKGFWALPQRIRWGIVLTLGCGLLIGLALFTQSASNPAPDSATAEIGKDARSYLFCFWNAENFFDDVEDKRPTQPDKDYDAWFAQDGARVFKQKVKNLTDVLLKLNDGKGPDILALAEVENERAAEKLRDALHARLKDPKLHYKNVVYKDPHGGRHIATAILSRLDVQASKTILLGRRQRILEAHLTVNGHDLVVAASHWTSRVSSKEDKEGEGRDLYAEHIYKRFTALHQRDPRIDFLVCGDFNDEPEDESVAKYLKATGDVKKVRQGGNPPLLLNLLAGRGTEVLADRSTQKEPGTHNYRRQWFIFDQIIVAPGLLDNLGWSCDPASIRIVNNLTAVKSGSRRGTPHDFGSSHDPEPLEDRGFSDHFPVTVRLNVAEAR